MPEASGARLTRARQGDPEVSTIDKEASQIFFVNCLDNSGRSAANPARQMKRKSASPKKGCFAKERCTNRCWLRAPKLCISQSSLLRMRRPEVDSPGVWFTDDLNTFGPAGNTSGWRERPSSESIEASGEADPALTESIRPRDNCQRRPRAELHRRNIFQRILSYAGYLRLE